MPAKMPKTPASSASSSPSPATAAPAQSNPAASVPRQDPMAPMQVDGVDVQVNDDPGDYYCEHTLFSTLGHAAEPGSSIVAGEGGPLAGFLHLPDDPETALPAEADQEQRHADTRRVVGAALRGYFDQISLSGGVADGEPYRILISGYGSFQDVVQNNPSGDFVAHEENLTEAMRMAFGPLLESDEPEQVDQRLTDTFVDEARAGGGPGVEEYYTATWRYQVRDPATGDVRDVLVTALRLPVTDQAIDPEQEGSVHDAMDTFQPHAVLSMGVWPDGDPNDRTFRAESRADDGGLRRDEAGWAHDGGQAPTEDRRSLGLANAIRAGAPHVR